MGFLGPVFWYDLVRLGRQGKYFVFRCLFALVLLLILYGLYTSFVEDLASYTTLQTIRPTGRNLVVLGIQARLSTFGERFFAIYTVAQFSLLFLLTPSLVAGAVTEEKQRRTMDYLLTTELTHAEIVLGKLNARVLILFLLSLSGLPVLSLVQLFGGIDYELVWAGFLAAVVLMLSLSSMSVCISVFARRVRESLLKSYLVIVGYFALWGILLLLRGLMLLEERRSLVPLRVLDTVLEMYNWGNPLTALSTLREYAYRTGSLGRKHWELLLEFTFFHGVIILLCLAVAIWQVRRVYVRQTYEGRRRPVVTGPVPERCKPEEKKEFWLFRARQRPQVGERPVHWKERYCERTFRFGVVGQASLVLGVILLLSPAVAFAGANLLNMANGQFLPEFGRFANGYLRLAGTAALFLLLIAAGVRAATSFGLEKDRQTWESLLATPLPLGAILRAKWWNSLWGVRWLLLLLVLLWGSGVVSLGIHWLAWPLLAWNSLCALVLASALGIYCSVRFPTTHRSLAMTIAGTILICLIPPVLEKLPFSWEEKQVWRNLMNLSPARMVYVTSVCPADDFDGWATYQKIDIYRRQPQAMRLYLSSREKEGDIDLYVLMTTGIGLFYLVCSGLLLLNAATVLRRECGRIDGISPRALRRHPPDQFHRLMSKPPSRRTRYG